MIQIRQLYLVLLILAAVGLLGFLFFQIGLTVNSNQALGLAILCAIVAAVFLFLYKYQGGKDPMVEAMRYAKKQWAATNDGERLGRLQGRGIEGYQSKQGYYSFLFPRIEGTHAGEFAKVIVKIISENRFHIAHFDELPDIDQVLRPFYPLDEEVLFTAAPTPEVQYRYYKSFGGPRPGMGPVAQVNVSGGSRSEEVDKK